MKNHHANLLGYTGLIPFLFIPFAVALDAISYFEGLAFFSQYAAIILSFLGGVLWFDTLKSEKPVLFLYVAMLPSIIGWLALVLLPSDLAILVLLISFFLLFLFEYYWLDHTPWYLSLRINLTAVAMGGHLMMLWLVWQP